MKMPFRKIGLAVAFSPTSRALLMEASRWAVIYHAELVLVHVGAQTDAAQKQMQQLITDMPTPPTIRWRQGNPVKEILAFCQSENIDLLLAGALKKENLLKNYIGTVARKIMRKADCSILMIQNPSETSKQIQNIVVNAEDSPYVKQAIKVACTIGELENAEQIHITRELKLLGLALTANEQCTEEEYNENIQDMIRKEVDEVQKILGRFRTNI